jgi:flagellar basal-body rod protein FlgB
MDPWQESQGITASGKSAVSPRDGLAHRITTMSSLDSTQAILAAAMRGSWQRQTLLTDNIANADTPGYKRQDVNFQATLQGAIAGEQSLEAVQFTPEASSQVVSPNGTGVSVDQESALLAENGLDYETLSQMLGAENMTLLAAAGVQP